MITDPRYLIAEASRLEENDLKFSPYRGWQIVSITFHSIADTDTDVSHLLTSSDPEGIQYQLLQSSSPMTVYHDLSSSRIPWQQGLIRLRSTCASGTAVLLLTVADAPVKSNPAPANSSFNMPVAKQATDLFGDTRVFLGNVGNNTWLDSFVGPGVGIDSKVAGVSGYQWQIGLRRNGADHGLFFADAINGKIPLFIRNFSGNYFVQPGPNSGPIALGNNAAPNQRWANFYTADSDSTAGYYERGRTARIGEWTTIAYNGANFTASGAQTWTVELADQVTFKFMLNGKTMFLSFALNGTSVGGVADTELRIAIPGGFLAKDTSVLGAIRALDNGTDTVGFCGVVAGAGYVRCWRNGFTNWAGSANNTTVQGLAIFETQ